MGQVLTADHWPTCAGEGFDTVTETSLLVAVLPLKSLATAASVCGPMLAVEVFHCSVKGGAVELELYSGYPHVV